MRISGDSADPGYLTYMQYPASVIRLDGNEIMVVTADTDSGEVLVEVLDERGLPKIDASGERFLTQVLRGKVEIDLRA